MVRILLPLFALLAAVATAPAQGDGSGTVPLRSRLETIFERPAGTQISAAQKQALRALVAEQGDRDLGAFGYVRALDAYLHGDPALAVERADEFFASHDGVPIAEHATMMGRIAMMGMLQADGAEARARHAGRCARLYPDGATILRALPRAMEGLDDAGRRALRLAIAGGVLRSERAPADQDQLLAQLYAGTVPAAAITAAAPIPAARIRALPTQPGAREAADRAERTRAGLTGQPAPALEIDHVVGGDRGLSLEGLRGKVVVLDFTATWCGPCRKIIPEMIALQDAHPEAVQVVAVTRYYTRGTDFDADGKSRGVSDLDRDAEIAVNERFRTHFGIDYPVAIVTAETMKDSYGVAGIPTVFVVGADGTVLGHAVGAGDAAHRKVEELVATGLAKRGG